MKFQQKIALTILLASSIPILVMVILHYHEMQDYKQKSVTEMIGTANNVSYSVNDFLQSKIQQIVTMSRAFEKNNTFDGSYFLSDDYLNESEFQYVCVYHNGRYEAFGEFESYLVLGSTLESLCNTGVSESIAIVNTGQLHIDVSLHKEKVLASKSNEISSVFPVRLINSRLAEDSSITAYIKASALIRILDRGLDGLRYFGIEHATADILDKNGNLIISTSRSGYGTEQHASDEVYSKIVEAIKKSGSGEHNSGWIYEDQHETGHLLNYYQLDKKQDVLGIGLITVYHEPVEELYAFANKWYYTLGMIAFFVFMISIGIAVYSSRIIIYPLKQLTSKVNMLRQGTVQVDLEEIDRADEVGDLIRSFEFLKQAHIEHASVMKRYETQYKQLKYAQDNVKQLLLSSPDAMLVVDDDGLIRTVNPAACTLFGYQAEDLEGYPVEKMIPNRYTNHVSQRDSYIKQPSYRPMGAATKLMALRKDGTEFPVSISLSPLESYEGRRVIATIRDETRRIKYETELRKLAAVAENTNNLVILTDRWGRIEWVNLAYENKTGYLLHEIRGKKPGDFMQGKDTDKNAVNLMREALRKGEEVRVEILNYTKAGRPIWLEMNIQPVNGEKGIENFIAIELDVTERRQLEEDLLQSNINLELRVKERTSQLEEALKEADAATRAKSAFLATMSHEIRTPMNGIVGMVDLMQRTELDTHQRMLLESVNKSSSALMRMIDDILDFSKIEAGKLELVEDDVSFIAICHDVSDALSTMAIEKDIKLLVDSDIDLPVVKADEIRIRQIMFNLVGNAIKFTDKTGLVSINLEYEKLNEEMVNIRISVSDTGIGIKEEALTKLFKPFTQADESTTRRFGGTGLGLSICVRLTELMGGSINADSHIGQGSVFNVDLPLKISEIHEPWSIDDCSIFLNIRDVHIKHVITDSLLRIGVDTINAGNISDVAEDLQSENIDSSNIILITDSVTTVNDRYYLEKMHSSYPEVKVIALSALEEFGKYSWVFYDRINPFSTCRIISVINELVNSEDSYSVIEAPVKYDVESDSDTVDFSKIKILVAEDNVQNQMLFKLQIQAIGANCVIAENGVVALEKWAEEDFDIIFTDCHMPEMDGISLTREIRNREKEFAYEKTPIIAITADAQVDVLAKFQDAGIDGLLTKPFEIDKLRCMLRDKIDVSVMNDLPGTDRSDGSIYTKPVDFSVVKSLVGGSDEAIQALMDMFIQNTPEEIQSIKDAFNSGDIPQVRSLSHKIKSTAKAMGAYEFHDLCEKAETYAADNKPDKIGKVLDDMVRAYQACEDYVTNNMVEVR